EIALRQGARRLVPALPELDHLQHLLGDAAPPAAERAEHGADPRGASHLDGLGHAQALERARDLERAREPPPDDRVGAQAGDCLTIERHASLVRASEAGDDVEERCLAGAVRTDDEQQLPARDLEADAVERSQTAEALGDRIDFKKGGHGDFLAMPDIDARLRSVAPSPHKPCGNSMTQRIMTEL